MRRQKTSRKRWINSLRAASHARAGRFLPDSLQELKRPEFRATRHIE